MPQSMLVYSGLLHLLVLLSATSLVHGATCVMPTVNKLTTDGCRDNCTTGLCVQYNENTEFCDDGICYTQSPQCKFQEVCLNPKLIVSLVYWKIHYVNIPAYWEYLDEVYWYGGPIDSVYNKGNYFDVTFNRNVFNTPDSIKKFLISSVDLGGKKLDGISMNRNWESVMFANTNLSTVPNQIKNMNKLTWLDLGLNNIEDISETLPSTLQSLNLAGNLFSRLPSAIFALEDLDWLRIDWCGITDVHLTEEQFMFLANISSLIADFSVTHCQDGFRKKTMKKFDLCVKDKADVGSGSSLRDGSQAVSPSTSAKDTKQTFMQRSWWVLLVCAAAIVLVIGMVLIVRRQRPGDYTSSYSKGTLPQDLSTSLVQSPGEEICKIWDDPVMQNSRIDYDALKLIKVIAHGNFGLVWFGMYENHSVVIKKLRNDKRGIQYVNAFMDEIKLMATLNHPHIVTFIGVAWHSADTLLAVTEYMDGGDLCSFLSTNDSRKRTWEQNKGVIATDVADALVYLHSFDPKIIHRDLKSRNIMLDHDLNAKLTDFGISRQQDLDHTMTACTGTVRWMAPELVAGERYNESVDIYSFGVVLTELDTHMLPFHDAKNDRGGTMSDMEIIQMVASGSLRPSFSPSCPESILQLGVRCLQFDPAARPTSMEISYTLHHVLYAMRNQAHLGERTMYL